MLDYWGGRQYKVIGKRIRDKPRLRGPSGSSQSRCMGAERERRMETSSRQPSCSCNLPSLYQ